MKNRILFLLLLFMCILLVGCNKKKEEEKKKDYDIISVEYSYSGSYGTEITTAKKILTFETNGKLNLSNSYDSSIKELEIGKDKYNELENFILDRISLFDKKPDEDMNVMDGSSSYLKVFYKDGTNKSFGGYMVKDKEFNEIEKKIFELVDRDMLDEYVRNIGKDKK